MHVQIVGGAGKVGQRLARHLTERGLRVTLAGRNLQALESVASEMGPGCGFRRLDLAEPAGWDRALEGVELAACCTDVAGAAFAQACFERGVHVVHITADHQLQQALESLDGLARERGAVGVLSVGLAPGLTNLLVQRAAAGLEGPLAADIGVLIGLGEAHGGEAVSWSVRRMLERRPVPSRRSHFGPGIGARRAWFMGFADQYVVPRTLSPLGVTQATTRLCYDPAPVTPLLFALADLWRWLRLPPTWLEAVAAKPLFGGDRWALAVEVTGTRETRRLALEGREEAAITAASAAEVIVHLAGATVSPGVCHAEQLEPSEPFIDALVRGRHAVLHTVEAA